MDLDTHPLSVAPNNDPDRTAVLVDCRPRVANDESTALPTGVFPAVDGDLSIDGKVLNLWKLECSFHW